MGEAMDTTKKRSCCLPCFNEGAGTGGPKRFQKICENSTNHSLSSHAAAIIKIHIGAAKSSFSMFTNANKNKIWREILISSDVK
jgi:hypothetical protein